MFDKKTYQREWWRKNIERLRVSNRESKRKCYWEDYVKREHRKEVNRANYHQKRCEYAKDYERIRYHAKAHKTIS